MTTETTDAALCEALQRRANYVSQRLQVPHWRATRSDAEEDRNLHREAASRIEALGKALRDARPVVANAAAAYNLSPWQKETRTKILATVDAVLGGSDAKG